MLILSQRMNKCYSSFGIVCSIVLSEVLCFIEAKNPNVFLEIDTSLTFMK